MQRINLTNFLCRRRQFWVIRDKGGPPASPVTKEEVKSERSQLMHLAKVARAERLDLPAG
jgi:hypothetical protein